jgi:hypothetical protein
VGASRSGWILLLTFFVGHWYKYLLSIDFIIALPCECPVHVVSSRRVRYNSWFSGWETHDAKRQVVGRARCTLVPGSDGIEDWCKCEAFGGEDSAKDGQWSSAAIAKVDKGECAVELVGAVAFKGEVFVKTIGVELKAGSKEAGGLRLDVEIEMPAGTDKRKKLSRTYSFECEES